MSLSKYQSMREFGDTPEPKGKLKKGRNKTLEFVVQKHNASHLHYDFRLELDGVLKSWAVPKGPSMNPADKRLAVAVEDHPYEYRKFEGVIPEGNYGAGNVIIWDKGTYTSEKGDDPIKSLRAGLKRGHLDITLKGQKLHGRFDLVREGDSKNWLLIKRPDDEASKADVTQQDQSVVSGRRVEAVSSAADLSGIKESPLPDFVKPMLATLVDAPFDKPGWLFELKFDGYRAIGARHKDKVQLYSRSGQDFASHYTPVAEALHQLPEDTIVDGEIVSLDEDGKPVFNWLQNWRHEQKGQLRYFVFDLLWYEGKDVRSLPLIDRKLLLKQILPAKSVMVFADHVEEKGEALFKQIQKAGLEGIMAKRADSPYRSGTRSEDWLKMKTSLRQEVVIGGFTEPRGSRKYLGSLLLGIYKKGQLEYVGHSGGGIPTDQLKALRERLTKLERATSPFAIEPKPNAPVHWVQPKLLAEVSFSEWTPDNRLRHPKYLGLRTDKPTTSVTAEKPKAAKEALHAPGPGSKSSSHITLTHEDKVFWPKLGITKGDIAHYYESVSERMLPYLLNRPHSLLRHPNGYNQPSFFQKDFPKAPTGIKTVTVHSESTDEDVHYLVCTGLDSLKYMVQLGCIEINPWHSTTKHLTKPDWLVMDLDPQDVDFKDVVRIALVVKKICDEWQLPSYPKTSGKKGLHVYIPTGGKYTYDQVKQLAELMGLYIQQREPELTSLERMPAKRRHKVYIDYLRNAEGQTLAAPYSLRPTDVASISTPLAWEEVTDKLKPTDFTIQNFSKRLSQPDPWKGMLGQQFDLKSLLTRLDKPE